MTLRTELAGPVGCSRLLAALLATLLADHASALRGRHRTDFLAGLAGSATAAGYRSAQDAEFDNLTRLPLRTWRYVPGPPVTDRAAQVAAWRAFGPSALIVVVTLSYSLRSLRGADPVPAAHDLRWTLVREHGRVVVAADDGLGDDGGVGWKGPWDYRPIAVAPGRSSLVIGESGDSATLRAVATAIDSAVPVVSGIWGDRRTRYVAVIVSASKPLTGQPREQRLVVLPGALARLSPAGRRITITHEVTHVVSARATTDSTPRWVAEGRAEYTANLTSRRPVRQTAAELRRAVRAGRLPDALPRDAALSSSGLVRLYRSVGAQGGSGTLPARAVAGTFETALHERIPEFVAQWRAYLSRQLRQL